MKSRLASLHLLGSGDSVCLQHGRLSSREILASRVGNREEAEGVDR